MARTPRRSRACYYTQGVLIPGCWAVTHSNDRRDCTCDRRSDMQQQVDRLQRQVRLLSRRMRRLEKRAKGGAA